MTEQFFAKLTDVCHDLLLDNENIMSYLKNRGITDQTINKYKIGAFPEDLRDLYNRYNMDPIELKEQNIIWNASQSQFQMYPLVIPIRNVKGNPIAIGCRTLLSDENRKKIGLPKYRNSVYKKTSHLFGLDMSIDSIRQNDKVYVVEGYFDAISAHQHNLMNVVATCGTIFTERQLIMLSRYTNNICLLFDNDSAGRRSAKKVMSKLSNFDSNVKLTCEFTPDGYKDLDEYLMKGGDISLLNTNTEPNTDVKTLW